MIQNNWPVLKKIQTKNKLKPDSIISIREFVNKGLVKLNYTKLILSRLLTHAHTETHRHT